MLLGDSNANGVAWCRASYEDDLSIEVSHGKRSIRETLDVDLEEISALAAVAFSTWVHDAGQNLIPKPGIEPTELLHTGKRSSSGLQLPRDRQSPLDGGGS